MKILHILDHYKPHFSGYVFRTASILKNQRELGLDPVLVTSPKHGTVDRPLEEIDGMRVYRTMATEFGRFPFIREQRLMAALGKRIGEAILAERPDVIHAHSPSLNAMPALKVARRHGIPMVYEVRAFWEDAAVDHGTFAEGSLKYRVSRHLETEVFRKADAVFTICEGLRRDIAARGISADKITIIPNCVDADAFAPLARDEELAVKLGVKGERVFGFIGSFYNYEGLELLLESFAKALGEGMKARLLLVGGGPEFEAVKRRTDELGLAGPVIITGKVPHEEVNRYYSLIDVLVYPRLSMRLTELVTPLKPLEAMAMGKVVAGSDVGGIKELVTHGHDGFLFPAGDVGALATLLNELASAGNDLPGISARAMDTVRIKHDWRKAVERYLPVYQRIVAKTV
ncbi:TIGR04063 family PEP-CTERM/XrtA system glycosyltransferase [Geobacter sp.]|uniref:TIGR04063 family PEP-CTERM/XrtA system glycosyltransferase n=1 Tax=Geobacter sp. TaxID=46610 RepID=UPI0027B8CCD5|nr:TIGR04063 family PEP-CTERM/XrtA system glycosyltransferase [Geobacter sp.]